MAEVREDNINSAPPVKFATHVEAAIHESDRNRCKNTRYCQRAEYLETARHFGPSYCEFQNTQHRQPFDVLGGVLLFPEFNKAKP